jgi:hypothetical protein
VNLCHFSDFCHPKNPYEKYTPPYGTARGDPILIEGTVFIKKKQILILLFNEIKHLLSTISQQSNITLTVT